MVSWLPHLATGHQVQHSIGQSSPRVSTTRDLPCTSTMSGNPPTQTPSPGLRSAYSLSILSKVGGFCIFKPLINNYLCQNYQMLELNEMLLGISGLVLSDGALMTYSIGLNPSPVPRPATMAEAVRPRPLVAGRGMGDGFKPSSDPP